MNGIERQKFIDLMREVRGDAYVRGWLEGHFLYPLDRETELKMVNDLIEKLTKEKQKV